MHPSLLLTPSEVAIYYREHVPHLRQTSAREWRGGCPVHRGRGPNFAVKPLNGNYFCYSQCGAGGSIYDLDQALYGGNFRAARDRVFRTIGRAIKYCTKQQKKELAAKRQWDQHDAIQAEYWRRGSLLTIEQQLASDKQRLFQSEGETHERLARDIRRHTLREQQLQTISLSELLPLFRQQYATDPTMASHLIRLGKSNLEEVRFLAVSFVRMLEIQSARERNAQ